MSENGPKAVLHAFAAVFVVAVLVCAIYYLGYRRGVINASNNAGGAVHSGR